MFRRVAITLLATAAPVGLGPRPAAAQYKNAQIGFDVGYFFMEEKSGLDAHAALVALRGAYKASDNWWFSARAGVSFRGERSDRSDNTVVLLHLQPVDARYYFLTDRLRPFAGVTSAFTFLANQNLPWSVAWSPGVNGGLEIRLRRDVYLGLEMDVYYNVVLKGANHAAVTGTTQLIFFL